ncbi:hypothetical protein AAG906_024058 [Vitis piasezkii]
MTHNRVINIFDIFCRIVRCDTVIPAPTEVHHLKSENLSTSNVIHWWYLWVPPIMQWKFLLPWLFLHVYLHHQPRTMLSHGSALCAVLQQLGVLRYGSDLACIIEANRETVEGFLHKRCGENKAVAQQKLRKPGVECGIGPLALFLWHPVSIPPTP